MSASLKCHPACELLPEMTDTEYRDLVEDIRVNGLRHAIIVDENGLILDGRHRYRALQELGMGDGIRLYTTSAQCRTEADKIALVMSENINRRHLTTQQRAAIAAELATMKSGARTDLALIDARSLGLSDAQAAKVMGVSEPSVERAKRRMRTDPEAHAKAKAGTLGRAKPTRRERDLGPKRAEEFVQAHPEADPAHARVTAAIREMRRALPQSFEVNPWALAQPAASRASLLEDLRHVRTMVDILMTELRRLECNVFAKPEPTEELSEELAAETNGEVREPPGSTPELDALAAGIARAIDQMIESASSQTGDDVRISPRTGKPVRKYTRKAVP
jgi:ParB-like chromosome segregation protein Spo0J